MLLNTANRYGLVALLLHWLLAFLILAQLWIGSYAHDLPLGMERLIWISRHKSLGITILLLMLLRLAWRCVNRPPAPAPALGPGHAQLALWGHRTLYALTIGGACSGWLLASASGLSTSWFGLVIVPDLVPKDRELAEWFALLHQGMVLALALAAAGHIAAALRHGLILKDGVLVRMLPKLRRS